MLQVDGFCECSQVGPQYLRADDEIGRTMDDNQLVVKMNDITGQFALELEIYAREQGISDNAGYACVA